MKQTIVTNPARTRRLIVGSPFRKKSAAAPVGEDAGAPADAERALIIGEGG
jgi:hypothetical protein